MHIRNLLLNRGTLAEGLNIYVWKVLYYFNVCDPFLLQLSYNCIVYIIYNHIGPN